MRLPWRWRRSRRASQPYAAAPPQRWLPLPDEVPAQVPPAEPPGVRLGFRDGSEVALDEADPAALALRAVAEVLVAKGPDPF